MEPIRESWADVQVRLPPPRPRIAPGSYQARSATLTAFDAFNRKNLELGFDVFQGEATDGVLLARIPLFIRMPGKRGLSPNSRLARLLYLLGSQPTRWTKVNLDVLRNKLWFVEIADAEQDSNNDKLSPQLAYSVIKRVISRLA
jgi:hypothetical protein